MTNTQEELEKQLPTFEEIAESIQKIAETMESIKKTRCSRKLIIELIHSYSKVRKSDIDVVLTNLERFDKIWLNPLR